MVELAASHGAMIGMGAAGVGAVANRKIVLPSLTGNATIDSVIDVVAGLAVAYAGTKLSGTAGTVVSGGGLGWAVSAAFNAFGI